MTEFKGTPHNTAKVGDIAETVVMPGDPLRAQFIAENYLEDPKEFNHVRNMLGYTGTYKGKRISVMAHGMGIPSMAIYSYELYKFYGVENIIRTGSCGGFLPEMKLFDVILAEAAYSESTFAEVAYGYTEHLFYPDPGINEKLEECARAQGKTIFKGIVHSGDAFYYDPAVRKESPYPVIAGEMESYALFANAKYLNKKAACLVSVSDKKDQISTQEERRVALRSMIEIALDAAIQL